VDLSRLVDRHQPEQNGQDRPAPIRPAAIPRRRRHGRDKHRREQQHHRREPNRHVGFHVRVEERNETERPGVVEDELRVLGRHAGEREQDRRAREQPY
jgi:hypothetical protein